MRDKILVTSRTFGKYHPDLLERLKNLGEVVHAQNPPLRKEYLSQIIHEYVAIVAGLDEYTSSVLEKAQRLKILARYGVGVDNVDLEKATELGIIVTYTPSANAISVAEHTLALILSLVKNIPRLNDAVKEGKWGLTNQLNSELCGKVLGIIGLGNIGSIVAKMAKALGMEVIAYSPYSRPDDAEKIGVKLVSLEHLLHISDIVSIHASYSPETHHMIGEKELKLMKKGAYIVNTARGGLIDEEVLLRALKKGVIAGAALDVFEREPPLLDNELIKIERVIVTPHCAAHTWEAVRRMGEMVTGDIEAVLRGEKPKYPANPSVFEKDNIRVRFL